MRSPASGFGFLLLANEDELAAPDFLQITYLCLLVPMDRLGIEGKKHAKRKRYLVSELPLWMVARSGHLFKKSGSSSAPNFHMNLTLKIF